MRERTGITVIYKPLRITCRIRDLAPFELDVRAAGTAIRLRPHGRFELHVTAVGPRKEIRIKARSTKWDNKRRKEKFRTLTT